MKDLQFNPYDFANPVKDPGTFAGRRNESDDVRYYLNQARHTRPIHLAVTGERSAGKTSMLNMIAAQANLLDFLVVRLDLNESDSDPIQFFGRLYDSLLTSAVTAGSYGGFAGKTWKGYRSLVDADKDLNFDLPLAFPAHWAAALQGTRNLSEAVLNHDLVTISAEVGRKIVLVLDECDVLSQKKITLQMLRNVFMNLDGFMLVIAGTPRLFPVFDDVFSPINRQFKKILISPFDDEEETEACIAQPLVRLNLKPRDIFKGWPYVGGEIHRVTGGRPYEIQLLCHTMFRRVQENLDSGMSLSLEVLDEVRADLENRQDHDASRFSRRYRGLSDKHLMALAILRRVDDGNLERAAIVHLITPREEHIRMTEVEFRRIIPELVDLRIINEEDGAYVLSGDQFDEVYLRYLAASRDLRIPAYGLPAQFDLSEELGNSVDELVRSSSFMWSDEPMDWFRSDLEDQLVLAAEGSGEFVALHRRSNLLRPIKKAQEVGDEKLRWVAFGLTVGSISFSSQYYVDATVEASSFEELASFVAFRERVEAANGAIEFCIDELSITEIPPVEELAGVTPEGLSIMANIYADEGLEQYRENNYQRALVAFGNAYRFNPSAENATSAAFMALHLRKWELAIEWADKADVANVNAADLQQTCIAAYDRAVAWLMKNDYERCQSELNLARENWNDSLFERGNFLLEPTKGEVGWLLGETRDPLFEVLVRVERALTD